MGAREAEDDVAMQWDREQISDADPNSILMSPRSPQRVGEGEAKAFNQDMQIFGRVVLHASNVKAFENIQGHEGRDACVLVRFVRQRMENCSRGTKKRFGAIRELR